MYRHSCILLLFFLLSTSLTYGIDSKGTRFLIGPETYYAYRHREGGTNQHGWLFGGRFILDHLRRNKFYWAAEGALAQGRLNGKSGSGAKLSSTLYDRSIEARLGYTFRYKKACRFCFTPFFGVGYLIEENNFRNPTPLHLHFKTAYRYLTAGFLSSIRIGKCFSAGVNVKVRHMIDPECKVSHDPDYETHSLKIDSEPLQYRVELPVTYLHEFCAIVATPFYERRSYGRQAGYPFDFLKTTLFNYGVTLQVQFSL